jgi:hypothetical protein
LCRGPNLLVDWYRPDINFWTVGRSSQEVSTESLTNYLKLKTHNCQYQVALVPVKYTV